jgi:hypothetical protein
LSVVEGVLFAVFFILILIDEDYAVPSEKYWLA